MWGGKGGMVPVLCVALDQAGSERAQRADHRAWGERAGVPQPAPHPGKLPFERPGVFRPLGQLRGLWGRDGLHQHQGFGTFITWRLLFCQMAVNELEHLIAFDIQVSAFCG